MMSDSDSEMEDHRSVAGRRNSEAQSLENCIVLNGQTMIIEEVGGSQEDAESRTEHNDWDSSLPYKYVNGDITFNELTTIMESNFSATSKSNVVIEEASDDEDDEEDEDMMSEDDEDEDALSDEDTDEDEKQHNRNAEEFEQMASAHDKTRRQKRVGSGKRKLAKDLLGLVGQANLHFARGDHAGAIDMCMEVIRLAPTSPEPFQTLSLIYEEQREFEKAYQYSLISAYLNPSDGENWIKVAEMAIELKNYQQAITCYNKAIKIYPKNLLLHQDRCKLYKLIGDKKKALDSFETLYSLVVKEPETTQNQELALQVAKEIAILHYFNKNTEEAIRVLSENFDQYQGSIMSEEVNLYLELLISSSQYVKALNAFQQYCGLSITVAGNKVDCLTEEIVNEQRDQINIELIYSELQIDLRSKLAVCLINLKIFKYVDELKGFITKENPNEMGDLFLDIADAYLNIGQPDGAEPLLKSLVSSRTYNCASVWLKYARVLRDVGERELAIDAYYEVIRLLPKSIEAKLELSDLLVKLGRVEDATEATGQLNHSQLNLDLLLVRCNLLFKQKMYKEFIIAGKILLASEFSFLANESEILIMINSTTQKSRIENLKSLYREQGDKLDVSELTGNDYNFVGNPLSADDLIDIFSKYCCALYESRQYGELIKMVFSSFTCGLYGQKSEYYDYLALAACMLTRNTTFLYRLIKTIIHKHPDNNQLWNVFSVVMLNIYQDFRHNKFCIRLSLKNQNSFALAFINGHNALTSGNYKVAMAEYVHVFKQDPTNVFAIFCILLGFTHLTCSKFITDKHTVVSQLGAFMGLYLRIRGECQESLYNVGRAFHQIGLAHEAIHFYKRALECRNTIDCEPSERVSVLVDSCRFL